MSKRIGRPRKKPEDKAKPNDKLICNICGGGYTRANISKHKKTQKHQIFEQMNDKVRKSIIGKQYKNTIEKRKKKKIITP
ncbi:zinc finger C2H2-type domain-containing protein [Megavirus courdo7]|uniref:Zinc finger C2H2-type domain-containing protein n=1 Tax=Megavirus courdo7 TaxID=1128135 RepID=H6WBD0_9VIRU|nr:zinc finger C2H2-type domain-containing protein [Megavirus courdo7]